MAPDNPMVALRTSHSISEQRFLKIFSDPENFLTISKNR